MPVKRRPQKPNQIPLDVLRRRLARLTELVKDRTKTAAKPKPRKKKN